MKAVVEVAASANGLGAAGNALKLADQVALGSTSEGRAAEVRRDIQNVRKGTARRIMNIGKIQTGRLAALNSKIAGSDNSIGAQEVTVRKQEGRLDAEKTTLATANRKLGELQRQRADNRNPLAENMAERATARAELGNARQQLVQARPRELQAPNEANRIEIAKQTQTIDRLGPLVNELDTEIGKRQGKDSSLADQVIAQMSKVDVAKSAVDKSARKLAEDQAKLATLKSEAAGLKADKKDMIAETSRQIRSALALNAELLENMQKSAMNSEGVNSSNFTGKGIPSYTP